MTPEMAIKLSVVIGSSPQMWLNLQNARSLAEAEKNSGCVAITPSGYAIKKWHFIKRHLELMTTQHCLMRYAYQAYTFTAIYWI